MIHGIKDRVSFYLTESDKTEMEMESERYLPITISPDFLHNFQTHSHQFDKLQRYFIIPVTT